MKNYQGGLILARAGFLLAAFVCTAIGGCGHSKPTVVLDNWWTIDYARDACKRGNNCGWDKDNPAGVLDYIASLKAAFAASKICEGVDVFDWRGPDHIQSEAPDDHETLMIDYFASGPIQDWSIEGKPSSGLSGKGTVAQIADAACLATRSKGATVRG